MGPPEGHIIEAQLTKGHVEIHLERCCLAGQGCNNLRVIRPRADVLSIVAARLLAGSLQGKVEGLTVEDRRFGVGHRQNHRESAGQRRGSAGIPIFLVGCSRLAQMDVRIYQAGEFKHLTGFKVESSRLKVQGWLQRWRLEAEKWITWAFGLLLPKG